MPSNFQIKQRSFFLTYPNCTLSKEAVRDFLIALGMKEYCVARELHQSGEPHIHALMMFENKLGSRNPRVFDIQGFHPNIQGCRSPKSVFTYIRKDGDFITNIGYKRTWGIS